MGKYSDSNPKDNQFFYAIAKQTNKQTKKQL